MCRKIRSTCMPTPCASTRYRQPVHKLREVHADGRHHRCATHAWRVMPCSWYATTASVSQRTCAKISICMPALAGPGIRRATVSASAWHSSGAGGAPSGTIEARGAGEGCGSEFSVSLARAPRQLNCRRVAWSFNHPSPRDLQHAVISTVSAPLLCPCPARRGTRRRCRSHRAKKKKKKKKQLSVAAFLLRPLHPDFFQVVYECLATCPRKGARRERRPYPGAPRGADRRDRWPTSGSCGRSTARSCSSPR